MIIGIQHLRRLHFHYHTVVDDQIHSVARYDNTVVEDWNQNFASNRVAATTQLQNKSPDVHILEKSEAEFVVNDKEGLDDRLSNIRVKQFSPGLFLALSGLFVVGSS